MKEKEGYRDNLERINEQFPNKEMLTISEVARFIGINRKKISKDWGKGFTQIGKSKYITKSELAKRMSP